MRKYRIDCMTNEIVNPEQLLHALNDEWKTSAQLRKELELTAGARKIGQALRKLRRDNRHIETVMKGRILLYRIRKDNILIELPQEIQPEPEVQPIEPPKNIGKELDSLIHELKSQGINVQEICYMALRDRKEKLESEIRYLKQYAPVFAEEYQKLKEELRTMKNEIQDYKERISQIESQDLVKRFSEERKAKAGVITG